MLNGVILDPVAVFLVKGENFNQYYGEAIVDFKQEMPTTSICQHFDNYMKILKLR